MTQTVLDTTSVDVLYRMAGDEGLLSDLPEGDGLLQSLGKRPVLEWHKQQVLEQVVLNTTLHSLAPLPTQRVDGDFWQMGILYSAPNVPEPTEEGRAISPDVLEGLLRAK